MDKRTTHLHSFHESKNAKFIDFGQDSITKADEYNSDNTKQLNLEEMKALLNKLKFIKASIKGKFIDPEE